MPEKNGPEKLRALLSQTVRIYEQALLERANWSSQSISTRQAGKTALEDESQQAEQRARDETGLTQTETECERLTLLLDLNQKVLEAAHQTLEQAGLGFIASDVSDPKPGSLPLLKSFGEAHLANVDLRFALFQLAQACLEQNQWEAVSRIVKPLLNEAEAPLYTDARDLLCESHYRPGLLLLVAQKWQDARREFGEVQKVVKLYRDVSSRQDETYWQPARVAFSAGKLDEAESLANFGLKMVPHNPQAVQILAEVKAQRRLEAELKSQEQEKVIELARKSLKYMAMIEIPAGKFHFGSKKIPLFGKEKYQVMLPKYYIGQYPVTNAQFIVFEDADRYPQRADRAPEKSNHPVVNISLDDAFDYCNWASSVSRSHFRLPSESEWEKAARGTDGRAYPWGEQKPDANLCNFKNTAGETTPVGQYSPQGDSPYGCADMAGNVWEWCTNSNGVGASVRGGAFNSKAEDLRCASYLGESSRTRYEKNNGFRVCISLEGD